MWFLYSSVSENKFFFLQFDETFLISLIPLIQISLLEWKYISEQLKELLGVMKQFWKANWLTPYPIQTRNVREKIKTYHSLWKVFIAWRKQMWCPDRWMKLLPLLRLMTLSSVAQNLPSTIFSRKKFHTDVSAIDNHFFLQWRCAAYVRSNCNEVGNRFLQRVGAYLPCNAIRW